MHPYIKHLLADIADAHRSEKSIEQNPLSFEEEMVEIEKWVQGENAEHTFGYYCGLETVNFPPPDQLTKNEMKLVIRAFGKMMFTWNHGIDLPKKLPIPIVYSMTIGTLNTKTNIVNSGMMNFDFCTGYAPDCIFKEYCPCLKVWNKADDGIEDIDPDNYEMPF